jgi:hypothetical protein
MVSEAIDHLVAIVVVSVIFVGTVVALPAINFSNIQAVDQQQLRNTALNVFDSMLLGVGAPSDWGSIPSISFNEDVVTLFGLSAPNQLSKFVLDSGKVQRLNLTYGPGISYDRVRYLLNIQQDYGFRLSIFRPFHVDSYLNITNDIIHFSVTVSRAEDETPIPNAEVKVTTMMTASSYEKDPITGEENLAYKVLYNGPYHTNFAGNCQADIKPTDLSGFMVNYAVAIMQISVGGMTTIVVTQNENEVTKYIKLNTFGDTIDLTFRNETVDNPSQRRVEQIKAFDFPDSMYSVYDNSTGNGQSPQITHGVGYESWSTTYEGLRAMDPQVLIMVLELTVPRAHDGFPARRLVLVAGPFSMGGTDEIFNFGNDVDSQNVIAVMRRLVVISDMTYIAQIDFWRE